MEIQLRRRTVRENAQHVVGVGLSIAAASTFTNLDLDDDCAGTEGKNCELSGITQMLVLVTAVTDKYSKEWRITETSNLPRVVVSKRQEPCESSVSCLSPCMLTMQTN